MLKKLLIIYTFITTLNPANKLSTWAVINGPYNKGEEATEGNLMMTNDMETWQPLIQTRNWLVPPSPSPPPTVAATTASSSISLLATSTPSLQSSSLRIKLEQQHLTHNQQPKNYLAYNHGGGNHNKLQATASSSTSLTPANSTNIKLKPYILHRRQQQQQEHSYHHHPNFPFKHIVENVYPKISAVDIKSQVQKPHMNNKVTNLKHYVKTDIYQHEHHHPSSSKSTFKIDNTHVHNPIDSINSTNPLNMFEIGKIFKDSKLKNSPTLNTRRRTADTIEHNIVNLNDKLLLLQATLNSIKNIYDMDIMDIIFSDKDNLDGLYSNEDEFDNNYDLPMLNFEPDHKVTLTSSTAEAAMTKEIPIYTHKNFVNLSSAPSIGEVQGHKRYSSNKGTIIKNSLISSLAEAAPSSVLTQHTDNVQDVQDTAATQAEITARGLLWNKSTPYLSSSSLQVLGTGRKVKKLKKKFQKFLLPLVLAYKLKFLALIPLLIGGLTLLVGTTGLAGFFFALFTAVMTLKMGSKNAIVVKKY